MLHAYIISPGRNAFMHAVLNEKLWMVKQLAEEPNFNLVEHDNEGNTALHMAARLGYPKITSAIVSVIILTRANIDLLNQEGMTPLMVACREGHLKVAQIIVFEGKASLNMSDNVYFYTAYEWIHTSMDIPEGVNPLKQGYKGKCVKRPKESRNVPEPVVFYGEHGRVSLNNRKESNTRQAIYREITISTFFK